MKFASLNEQWEKKCGWKIFKPLHQKDQYCFDTLHRLTSENNEKEFDEQIGKLVKITIDSLNQEQFQTDISSSKNEKGSITIFEQYLASYNFENKEIIEFLRKFQALRSCSVAHRKSDRKDTKKVFEYFEVDKKDLKNIFDSIMNKIIHVLDDLESILIHQTP